MIESFRNIDIELGRLGQDWLNQLRLRLVKLNRYSSVSRDNFRDIKLDIDINLEKLQGLG